MNARIAAALLVLLAALGGGALLVRNEADSQKSPDAGTLGQPLLKGLQASQVASIAIRQPKGAITIARKDERWTIVERVDKPKQNGGIAALSGSCTNQHSTVVVEANGKILVGNA